MYICTGQLIAPFSPLGCLHLRLLCHFLIGNCLLLGQPPEHGLSYSLTILHPAGLMDRNLPRCEIDCIAYFNFKKCSKLLALDV